MVTEVLLMADVQDLGAEGDVVQVADGYARNYLLARKLGAPVTAATRRSLKKLQENRDAARKAETASAAALAARLAKTSCTIVVKVGKDDQMFGSVTTADIAESLQEQEIEIDRHKLVLEEPIKELGVYDIKVKLHPDVDASVKVWVVEE